MENVSYLGELVRIYKPEQAFMDRIMSVFMQDDSRYRDTFKLIKLAGFLANKAISIKEEAIQASAADTKGIQGPQKGMKTIASGILKERGYRIESIERGFAGFIPDVLACKGAERIAAECGPCDMGKAINYLEKDSVLWILRPEGAGRYTLFTIEKGENWASYLASTEKEEMILTREHIQKAFKKE